jgi:hypothetical protein
MRTVHKKKTDVHKQNTHLLVKHVAARKKKWADDLKKKVVHVGYKRKDRSC